MLALQGLFKSLSMALGRNTTAIFKAISAHVNKYAGEDKTEKLLDSLKASQQQVAQARRRSRKGGGRGGADGHHMTDDEADIPLEADADSPWTVLIASVVERWDVHLAKSLLDDKPLKYYVEWRGTVRVRRAMCRLD